MTRSQGDVARDSESAPEVENKRLEREASEAIALRLEGLSPEEAARERLSEAERELSAEADASALERFHAELDESVLERLEQRFGPELAEERLLDAREHATQWESNLEYQAGLAEKYPRASASERATIIGDFREGTDPHVDASRTDAPTTVAHERLHQLSAREFRETLGAKLDEGTTELLAQDVEPEIPIAGQGDVYPEEQRLAGMMAARVGPELEHAYLTGDLEPLRDQLDAQLGDGALDKLAELTHEDRLEEAENLVKGD